MVHLVALGVDKTVESCRCKRVPTKDGMSKKEAENWQDRAGWKEGNKCRG